MRIQFDGLAWYWLVSGMRSQLRQGCLVGTNPSAKTGVGAGAFPLLAFIPASPILSLLGFPLSCVAIMFFIAWFLHVNKRVSAWRYDLRVHGFLQGTCRKPTPKYRANLERLLLAFDLLVIFGLWWFGGPLFESP